MTKKFLQTLRRDLKVERLKDGRRRVVQVSGENLTYRVPACDADAGTAAYLNSKIPTVMCRPGGPLEFDPRKR